MATCTSIGDSPDVLSVHNDTQQKEQQLVTQLNIACQTAPSSLKKKGNEIEPVCVECSNKELSKKYRCPHCRYPYCSLACWKLHKLKCSASSSNSSSFSSSLPSIPMVITGRKRQRQNIDEEEEELKEGWKLPLDKLEAVASDTHLKTLLKDENLRKYLIEIDCAKDREKTLKKIIEQTKNKKPDVEVFLRSVLRAIGVYETRADGTEIMNSNFGNF